MPVPTLPHRRASRQRSARRRGWNAGALVVVVNGVIASLSGVYVATRSIPVTLAGGALAVALAGWLALLDR
jgi:hypothetical protein